MEGAKKTIFIMGDSISIHYTPHLKRFLSSKFNFLSKNGEEEACRNLDIPAGANGGDSRMVLKFLEHEDVQGRITYDYMLLNCGLHDIKVISGEHQIHIDDYIRNLKEILKIMKKNKVEVIWIKITPVHDETHNRLNKSFRRYNKDVQEYNEAAEQVMQEQSIPIIDLYTFTETFGPEAFCDHVHFKDEYRALHGAFIAGAIMDSLY